MNLILRRQAIVLAVLALILTPFQAGATAIDPGATAGERQLLFSPVGVEMEIEEVVGGIDQPIHVTNAGDGSGRLFVSARAGTVWIVEDGHVLPDPFLDISEIVRDEDGEQGFFAIEFHPDYTTNGYFYAVYTKQPAGANTLARFSVSADDPNQADAGSLMELLSIPDTIANHNGGDLAFGPNGYLYIGTGDEGGGGDPNMHAQNPLSLFGKMLRLDVDGGEPYAIPSDNPFVDDPDVLDEIWAVGLRNPWRFSFDSETGDMYIGDVGQAMWEEIDFQPADSPGGINYGWPIMEAFVCYPEDVEECDMTGLTPPILAYSHAGEPGVREGCSVTGGEVYRGEAYPFMDGAYIFADWCEGRVWAGYQDDAGEWQMTQVHDSFINWTDIGMDESGELYGTDLIGGRLFRFTFTQQLMPVVTQLVPGGALAGEPAEVTIHGENFAESAVALLDVQELVTSYVSDTELVAELPGELVAEASVYAISVRNYTDSEPSEGVPFLVSADSFGDDAFAGVWSRTDELVADGVVSRTWIWGPAPNLAAQLEPYAEGPDGWRVVLYFDKSRMEITNPSADSDAVWYVTNGLLVVELMSGELQVGDDAFVQAEAAEINVAGDPGDDAGVTYATLAGLRDAPALAEGTLITTTLAADGTTATDGDLAQLGVRAGPLAVETGHRVASVFWDFMTSEGPVLEDGVAVDANLFENAYFATGFPVTEAYWTTVEVGGTPQEVLLQCFERRCLTYTPGNAAGWQVEAGNVGLHYHAWRYGE